MKVLSGSVRKERDVQREVCILMEAEGRSGSLLRRRYRDKKRNEDLASTCP